MDQLELASRFDRERPRLRAVAYRIVGSLTDADDALQEAWLRLQRTDVDAIDSLAGWLTPIVSRISGRDPEHEMLLADAVGIALQVILESLSPPERLAFVLHDMFEMPFNEIAALIDRSPDATRQLASRARRRIRESAPPPEPDLTRQRAVVDAYFAAAREGDLEALVAVLAPDVIARSHRRTGIHELRGAKPVARAAMTAREFAPFVQPALINGAAGAVAFDGDSPFAILAFTIVGDQAVAIDIFNDRDLVPRLLQPHDTGHPGNASSATTSSHRDRPE
jgi:RNA polymerase sigma-70 factor, ECF subfamily